VNTNKEVKITQTAEYTKKGQCKYNIKSSGFHKTKDKETGSFG
jgi:hypothetical protein